MAAAAAQMFGRGATDANGGAGGGDSDNNNDPIVTTASSLAAAAAAAAAMASSKEPPPLGLAGLEAFRREYLTSPLSHLRNMGNPLLPPFPPLLPPLGAAAGGGSPAPPDFGSRSNPNRSSLSGVGTPPSERERERGGGHGSAHSTPSSEFSSQQNWSFEEQFKQVSG